MNNPAHTAVVGDFAPAAPSFFATAGKVVGGFFYSLTMALVAHRLYHELDGMGDHELAKHGLSRDDIPTHIAKTLGWIDAA